MLTNLPLNPPLDRGVERAAADGADGLIDACLAGDTAAHEALYERYAAYVYRLAYGLLRHREDAEEVLQDTFTYAFRRLARYDPAKAAFKTWLYSIAVSRARNKRRRKLLPTFSLSDPAAAAGERGHDPWQLPDESAVLPEEELERRARRRLVWVALGELSDKLRETALLRYYEDLTYEEIGQILNIPAKTAESRMRLAHAALKERLSGIADG